MICSSIYSVHRIANTDSSLYTHTLEQEADYALLLQSGHDSIGHSTLLISLEQRILNVLEQAEGVCLSPHEISHRVGFSRPDNQAWRINPTLFVLLEEGKIERHIINRFKVLYRKKINLL